MKEIEKELHEHGSKICRDVVNDNYVRLTLQKYTGGIIYKQNNEIVAFSLWTKETIKKGIFAMKLYVLCARENNLRLGSHMLRDLEIECLNENMEQIILSPVDGVNTFYKKMNYTYNNVNTTKTMKKNIPKFTITRSKNIRKTRKIRTTRSLKNNVKINLDTTNLENN